MKKLLFLLAAILFAATAHANPITLIIMEGQSVPPSNLLPVILMSSPCPTCLPVQVYDANGMIVTDFGGGGGGLTSVAVDAPLTGLGTSGSHIAIPAATNSVNGYLTSADHATFAAKQSSLIFGASVSNSGGTVTLSNDAGSPGNSKYYGTDAGGTKGFFTLPTASNIASTNSVLKGNGSGGAVAALDGTDFLSSATGLSSVTVDSPLTGLGTSSSHLSMPAATNSVDGYLSATDHTTFNAKQSALTFSQSLSNSGGTVTLSGDTASPGNTKLYGTNGSGVKGWYDQPAGGGGGATNFTGLADVPGNYTGKSDQFVKVKTDETGLTFVPAPAGAGDVTGPSSSVDSELALFSSTSGKVIKRATGTGIPHLTSGVLSSTSTIATADIANNAVDFTKTQTVTTNRLLGRSTAGTGNIEQITPGTGLSLASGTLSNSGVTSVTGTASQVTTSGSAGAITLSLPATINVNTSGNAATATALAANGTNCSAGQFAQGVDASGNAEGCSSPPGTGDVVGPSSSVDGELALFNSTTGKLIKRGTGTGIPHLTSGVLSSTSTIATADIANNAVDFTKTQQVATQTVLGRSTAATGNVEALAVGTGILVSGGTISNSGATSITGTANRVTASASTGAITISLPNTIEVNTTGNAATATTATALAANGTNCAAGQFATGVDASGNAEGCAVPTATGNVIGPGTNTDNFIPQWNGANSKTLKNGLGVASANTASTVVQRDGSGNFSANIITATLSGAATTAGTATALAANGANCSAGQAAAGVDAQGNAEGCFTPSAANPITASDIATSAKEGNGTKVQMFKGADANTGNLAVYDVDHNLIDGGAPPLVIAGANTQLLRNNAGVMGAITGCTSVDGITITCGAGKIRLSSPIIADNIQDVNGNIVAVLPGDGTWCVINCNGGGGVKSGFVVFNGATSGSGRIGAAAAAGTPNEIKIPTATGAPGTFLQTDGGNPQQTSWAGLPDHSVNLILQSDQTITNDTLTTVLFGSGSEDYDTDTMHDTVSNTDRITFTTAGKYHVCATVSFAANTTGERQMFFIENVGNVIKGRATIATSTTFQSAGNLCIDYNASAASYLRLNIYQNSGGDLNAKAASTLFSAHKFN